MNIAIGVLAVALLVPDPWQILGVSPTPTPPPEPDLVVTGKLVNMARPSFGCGYYSIGAMAEYTDLDILRGTYDLPTLFAVHPCPEIPSTACPGSSASLLTLEVGEYHHLELSRTNFEKLELLFDDGVPHAESTTYFVICASPAPPAAKTPASLADPTPTPNRREAPPNPSLQRTPPG